MARIDIDGLEWNGERDRSIAAVSIAQLLSSRCPPEHPDRGLSLLKLSDALGDLWYENKDDDTFMAALVAGNEALEYLLPGHSGRVHVLRRLGKWCSEMHHEMQYVKDAATYRAEAVQFCPPGRQDRPALLRALATSHQTIAELANDQQSLEKAIMLLKQALDTWPANHVSGGAVPGGLDDSCKHFDCEGYTPDTVTVARKRVYRCHPRHWQRGPVLHRLSQLLLRFYFQSKTSHATRKLDADTDNLANLTTSQPTARELLNECVVYQGEYLSSLSVDHDDYKIAAQGMIFPLILQFLEFRDKDALQQAVAIFKSISGSSYAGLRHAAQALVQLGSQAKNRDALSEAICLEQEALELRPPGHPEYIQSLLELSETIYQLHLLTGDMSLLGSVTKLQQGYLRLTPRDDGGRPKVLINLCISLTRMGVKNSGTSIEDILLLAREAVSLCPDSHSFRDAALQQLAHTLHIHGDMTGDVRSYKEGTAMAQESLDRCPPGEPLRMGALRELADCALMHGLAVRDPFLMQQAVNYCWEAVRLIPPSHPDHVQALQMLSFVQSRWGHWAHDIESMDLAITCAREALAGCDAQDHRFAFMSNQLAETLYLRRTSLSAQAKLDVTDESIRYRRTALAAYSLEHPEYTRTRLDLAGALSDRFDQSGDVASLDESIELSEESLQKDASNTDSYLRSLFSLSWAYVLLYRHNRQTAVLVKINECMQKVMDNPLISAFNRVRLAQRVLSHLLSNVVTRYDVDTMSNMLPMWSHLLETAIQLLPLSACMGVSSKDRLGMLRGTKGLGPSAAAVALLLKRPKEATELLEETNSLFWAQPLQLRTPLDDIPLSESEKLRALFQVIQDESRDAQLAGARIQAGKDAEELIEAIRQRPQFDRFLLPQTFQTLALTAERGPVVILVTHSLVCEAIIILDTAGTVKHVPLLGLSNKDADELAKEVKATSLRKRADIAPSSLEENDWEAEIIDLGENPKTNKTAQEEQLPFGDSERKINIKKTQQTGGEWRVLRQLWENIVSPVISALNLKTAKSRNRPRLHWCPTGDFSFLPLHAACSSLRLGDSVSDYVVSSYTPTLTAVLNARRVRRSDLSGAPAALLVAEANAPGMPALANAEEEIDAITEILSSYPITTLTVGQGDGPTISSVLDRLPEASILHLACHGEQDPRNALESGFCLHDGRLSVAALMKLDLPRAFFAFLSACETAKGDAKQPDQAVHLAATMLFVGFRSVVATMWSMNDEDGPLIARTVYSELVKYGLDDVDTIPYALDLAVEQLRKKGVPPYRWAPYIHMGA